METSAADPRSSRSDPPATVCSFEGTPLARRYRLGPLVARGGFGAVHVAVDERTGTKVAIKVFETPERGSAREGLAR